jgi:hypothetical protein
MRKTAKMALFLWAGTAISVLAQSPAFPPPMPYKAIDNPEFVSASQATFLLDDDIVIGVARGDVAKAYPVADLAQHGVAMDQMPDGPISVTFCITCNTAAVFRTEVNGQRLHFEFDSMVGANEVDKDRETGSRWQQSTGEAISGPLKGSHLELYPFVRTTWKEWRRRFPNAVALKPLPGYAENMPSRRARINEGIPGGLSAPKGAFGQDARLRPKEIVAGLTIGGDTAAYPFSVLRDARVVNDKVGGLPVLVVHQPSSDTTTAFEARANGKALRFQAVDGDASRLVDFETHSTWDAYGLCLQGPMKGIQLKTLILVPEFWFAWSEFHPLTKVFMAGAQQSSK